MEEGHRSGTDKDADTRVNVGRDVAATSASGCGLLQVPGVGAEIARGFAPAAARYRAITAEDWLATMEGQAVSGPGGWWVLHTRARNEKHVASVLAEQHVRHYLPLVRVRHTYAKAKVCFHVPLFPGYVFMHGDAGDCDKARKTNRVASILHVADQKQLRAELQHVWRVVEGGQAVELFPALQVGQRCRITHGPMHGVEGTVVRHGGRCRMYLSVSMLGQSAVVEVDAALLEAVG